MRFLFICGSLEPGRDGVGDYTRRLAAELIRKGHSATIVSLFDPYIASVNEETQTEEGIEVSTLRLPSVQSWKRRLQIVERFLAVLLPDWLSLQYVPYAFHRKGLPLKLVTYLKSLHYQGKWHIMFHELWVGKEDGVLLRIKLLSYLQKRIIDQLIKKLHPAVIHTHLPAYKDNLAALGWTVNPLPLFSNIEQKGSALADVAADVFRVAFFSQVGASSEVFKFLNELEKLVKHKKMKLEIILLGGSSAKMQSFGTAVQKEMQSNIKVTLIGFVSSFQLSEWLNSCEMGITPLLKIGLGKSGSVAAFLEHGLPVGVPASDNSPSPFFYPELNDALIMAPTFENTQKATIAAKKAKLLISLSTITNTFITDLQTISRHK